MFVLPGADKLSKYFDGFLDQGLMVAFDKLMNDEAMKDWKIDIHVIKKISLKILRVFSDWCLQFGKFGSRDLVFVF